MRAATINDEQLTRPGASRPRPGARRGARPGARRRAQRRRHAPARRSLSRASRLTAGHPGARARRRGRAIAARAPSALRSASASCPSSAVAGRPSWPPSTSASSCRCPTTCPGPRRADSPRSSPPRTTRCSPRPAWSWASGCSSTAPQAAWAAPRCSSGRPRARRSPPRCATPTCVTGWATFGADVYAPDDFLDQGPYDVILELVGAVNLMDNLKALNTGGRIAVIGTGAGATGEINLGLADDEARAHPRLHAAGPPAGAEGADRAGDGALGAAAARRRARSRCRSPRPTRSPRRPPPTSTSRRAASWARSSSTMDD